MRVALYARVSTDDKGQDPETQLVPLREFVRANGHEVAGEFVDQASAGDMARRGEWARLLALAAKRKLDVILVWRMDRAFRSVRDAANTLEQLRHWGVGLRSYSEPWLDTTSPFGEAMFHITVVYAQLERAILRERVRAGMDRARRQGKHVGRPRKDVDPASLAAVLAAMKRGELSVRQGAKRLRIGRATLYRLLSQKGGTQDVAAEADG